MPTVVAFFILSYNIYWFLMSLQTTIAATISHLKIQSAIKHNWLKEAKKFKNFKKTINLVIIPTYKEPLHILERTLNSLLAQSFPKKQIIVIIAMEKKEDEKERKEKIKQIKRKFGKTFKALHFTTHQLTKGEVAGKSSNERYAALWFKHKYIKTKKVNIKDVIVTSCDADHKYHPNHFSQLTYLFLKSKQRYNLFWQPAILFYNNIWEIPPLTRVTNTLGSIWNLAQISRKDKLINQQNYSLSLKLLDDAGYWDPDKIPEDWGIFFKAFFKKNGNVEVEPIYTPIYVDAAQAKGFWKTLKNQYEQYKRWAWGVSDLPWIIKNYFSNKEIPFFNKTTRVIYAIWSHIQWPTNWFVITIGITLPSILNPAFSRTSLGHMVPKISSVILTSAACFLLIMLIIDRYYKPEKPKKFGLIREILVPIEFLLMPIVGFFLSALPGLESHTRLMLGKYIEYRVTEKV